MKKLISIIIPMYNEEESLPYLYDRLTKLSDKIEIIIWNFYLLMMEAKIIL